VCVCVQVEVWKVLLQKSNIGDVGQVKLRGPSINFALVLVVRLLYRSS
jgi:hypothetical protein